MSDTSKIEWTDATWNVVTGCEKVSPGCDNCYAETFAERWRGTKGHHFENGFDITLRPERLTLPLTWKRPRKVFVNSMSDLFHKDIPDDYIAQVFAVMAATPQHTYQVLTKRHGRMRALLSSDAFRLLVKEQYAGMKLDGLIPGRPLVINIWPLRNVWLGVSVENQQWADLRIPALLDTPAAVRFLSCEPLLGPVTIPFFEEHDDCTCAGGGEWPHESHCGLTPGAAWDNLHWVIVGGESGRGARPMSTDWVRSLRDQCAAAGVPFFFKQLGTATARQLGIPGKGADLDLVPADLRIREFANV